MTSPKSYKLPDRWPRSSRIAVAPAIVEQIREQCRNARYLDAWQIAKSQGPLQSWASVEARLAGAILANHTGGGRLSDLLDVSCYREAPQNPEAQVAFISYVLARRSPLEAWRILRRLDLDVCSPRLRARLLAQKAQVATVYRDFDSAKQFLNDASRIWPEPAWNDLQRSTLYSAQDRWEEALEAAQSALAVRPWYRPAVEEAVEAFKSLNRDEDAIALLNEALTHLQSASLAVLLVGIRREHEDFAGMLEPLALYEEWSPLMEPGGRRWLCGSYAEALYHCGRLEEGAEWAERSGTDYHIALAARLRSPDAPRKRVRLQVGFVRQHHHTCAPATLAALASFQGLPVLQREIAEEICYDGTYDFHERRWAEDSGCFVREFRVTWEATKTLIDLGIPFAMVTSNPGAGHLQGVIGYDEMRATLLIREPSDREYVEFIAEDFFKRYLSIGPRGMAFVPEARREALAAIDLPEAALYDACYALNCALDAHDRERAVQIQEQMEGTAPGHRLTIVARRMVADYDCNLPEQLESNTALLAQYPGDERLELARIYCLRELGRRDERVQALASLCAREEIHPIFWREYAVELSDDAREHNRAMRCLLRAHRQAPTYASVTSKIADITWNLRKLEEAVELYRFAFCQDDKNEQLARSFFIASRHVHQADLAIDFLRRRFESYGAKSDGPACTLFHALDDLDRVHEAFEVLEEAIRRRPADGMLLLLAADQYARYNRVERSAELLTAAEKSSRRATWLRTSARLAANRGAQSEALGFWRQVIELEPLEQNAHREATQLLARMEGRASALEHLERVCERFPHHFELHRLWLEMLREESNADAEHVARRLVDSHPTHAWARRELASILCDLGKLEEADAEARIARTLNPTSSSAYNVIGAIEERRGEFEKARECFRQAIRVEVDNRYAIDKLIKLAPTTEEKRRELAFVRSELNRQVVFGDGLQAYRAAAQRVLDPDDLLAALSEVLKARPDLWHAWSASAQQLASCGQQEAALEQALEMTRRFPLVAGSWRTLAQIHESQDDWTAVIAALEKAIEISPDWGAAVCELSEAYERVGERSRGRSILESALARNPLDVQLHGYLADCLRKDGETNTAIGHLRRAVQLDPDYDWAWNRLRDWGGNEEPLRMARELTEMRGGEARSWFILAGNLDSAEHEEEQLQALDRATELNPQHAAAWDFKAQLFVAQKRFEEALAACDPPAWRGQPPTLLRGRAAWVEAQRGNFQEAIQRMRKVLADNEDYYWGWARLADWLDEEGDFLALIEAARQMVRWQPKSAVPHGYLGDAKLKLGDRYGAVSDLQRAFVLDPAYGFAGWTLFRLQLEDEDFDAAEMTLATLREHHQLDRVLSAEVKLALRRGQLSEAVNAFEKLGRMEEADSQSFENLVEEFETADALEALDRALGTIVEEGFLNPAAAAFWARRATAKNQWDLLPVIEKFLASEASAPRAVEKVARAVADTWFQATGNARRRLPRLRNVIRDHGDWLQREVFTWGILGYALSEAGEHRLVVKWLAAWREQKDVEPWMLLNLNDALRTLGRLPEAREVTAWAVKLGGSDDAAIKFRCYHALDLALAGKGDDSAAEMIAFGDQKLSEQVALLLELITAVNSIRQAPQDRKRAVFHTAIAKLAQVGARISDPEASLVVTMRETMRSMARTAGVPLPWRYSLRVRRRFFSRTHT